MELKVSFLVLDNHSFDFTAGNISCLVKTVGKNPRINRLLDGWDVEMNEKLVRLIAPFCDMLLDADS